MLQFPLLFRVQDIPSIPSIISCVFSASDPISVLGLLNGKDIEIIEFHPPPLRFAFEKSQYFILYSPPVVKLTFTFGVYVTVDYALVLDSKGIREAVQEKNPLKALNSFAIQDIIDGKDSPLIVMEAKVSAKIDVSAIFVAVSVSGGLTIRVEVDLYDPYPSTSGGLVRLVFNYWCVSMFSFMKCLTGCDYFRCGHFNFWL